MRTKEHFSKDTASSKRRPPNKNLAAKKPRHDKGKRHRDGVFFLIWRDLENLCSCSLLFLWNGLLWKDVYFLASNDLVCDKEVMGSVRDLSSL